MLQITSSIFLWVGGGADPHPSPLPRGSAPARQRHAFSGTEIRDKNGRVVGNS